MSEAVALAVATLAATLRVATPLVLCAMGGLFSERSGIIDVGLEGKMLMAAFFSAAIAAVTHSAWWGVAAGIAVSLMGRNHPLGIVLAAVLFGALQQGGAELSFDIPNINREMVVVIQGLVILFSGALVHLPRPWLQTLFALRRPS